MPFTHRGHGPRGFEVQDIHQARTQTNKMCIFAENPELLSVFFSEGTDVLIQRGSLPQLDHQRSINQQLHQSEHSF